MEPLEVVEETEEAEGQTKPLKVPEDLLAMVKKLHKEGSLEPQIEDLINRINELQQAKKKSSEELVEAQALWESLQRELDSLNGEKAHLEEVLSKKQEALRILQLHCQMEESGAQRFQVEEQLETLMSQHKDLWELHMLKQRLAWEIHTLQSSKEQLLTEGPGQAAGGGAEATPATRDRGRPDGERWAAGGGGDIRGAGHCPNPLHPKGQGLQRRGRPRAPWHPQRGPGVALRPVGPAPTP
ncbi:synaptonemal complex central element protein 1-like isoform X2 [Suricata suricatta]|uniref:synaptonemal complex central element protein 1-like isoform X2 n=1 Tax=Suricata suricatta TaxID=37032 RepID=UPI0011559917|nr:synaptonemal complex central element protein 1-like isoform X2 [Suricata suricatta]